MRITLRAQIMLLKIYAKSIFAIETSKILNSNSNLEKTFLTELLSIIDMNPDVINQGNQRLIFNQTYR